MGLMIALSGCRTRLVNTDIVNQGPMLQLLEFDYPSASFGADQLPSGGRYHYNFQIRGSGPLTLHYDDASGKSHTAKGPTVREGEQGSLTVTIDAQNQVRWSANLK
jgi:hypothetical protein